MSIPRGSVVHIPEWNVNVNVNVNANASAKVLRRDVKGRKVSAAGVNNCKPSCKTLSNSYHTRL
jgi:hypothetical protein